MTPSFAVTVIGGLIITCKTDCELTIFKSSIDISRKFHNSTSWTIRCAATDLHNEQE